MRIANYPKRMGEKRLWAQIPVLITRKNVEAFEQNTGLKLSYRTEYGSYVAANLVYCSASREYRYQFSMVATAHKTAEICASFCREHNRAAGYTQDFVNRLLNKSKLLQH